VNRALTVACLASLLAACGGGGSGGTTGAPAPAPAPAAEAPAPAPAPAPEAVSLAVQSFLPGSATGVSRDTKISATFNRALRAETVTAANLGFTRSGTAVPGTLTYDAARFKAAFVPRQPLDLLASYTVTAGTGLQDEAGEGLPAQRSWTFRTADGSWQAPRQLEAASTNVARITASADGHAVSAWKVGSELRGAAYDPVSGWGPPATVATFGPSSSGGSPSLGSDGQGNALLTWMQAGADAGAWSARYVQGQGWQAPVRFDPVPDTSVRRMSLTVSAAGDAFAVYARPADATTFGSPDEVWAARFTPAGGWEPSVRLGSPGSMPAFFPPPAIAVDQSGNALALWLERGSTNPVWSARYVPGSGWQPAVLVAGGWASAAIVSNPQLAVSASGQALALWDDTSGTWSSFQASPGGAWSAATLLDGNASTASDGVVADSAGRFHVLWYRFVFGGACNENSVQYARYIPGAGWDAALTLGSGVGACSQLSPARFASDRNGNLQALWGLQSPATSGGSPRVSLWSRRFDAVQGWQPAMMVQAPQDGEEIVPQQAGWPDGSSVATWMVAPQGQSAGPIWWDILK